MVAQTKGGGLRVWLLPMVLVLAGAAGLSAAEPGKEGRLPVRVEVLDADAGRRLPARVYLQGQSGEWFFARSESADGSAISYRRQRPDAPRSVEMHTTVSAHPFRFDVPPGRYTLTVERGKEYLPHESAVTVAGGPVRVQVKLRRWINLAERGWYCGDTHVHRSLEELPNVMAAEDVNVAFPLLYWVTEAFTSPRTSPRSPPKALEPKVIAVDATHVIYPRNTEYEIFTVAKSRTRWAPSLSSTTRRSSRRGYRLSARWRSAATAKAASSSWTSTTGRGRWRWCR
jgi:hypothetical protein